MAVGSTAGGVAGGASGGGGVDNFLTMIDWKSFAERSSQSVNGARTSPLSETGAPVLFACARRGPGACDTQWVAAEFRKRARSRYRRYSRGVQCRYRQSEDGRKRSTRRPDSHYSPLHPHRRPRTCNPSRALYTFAESTEEDFPPDYTYFEVMTNRRKAEPRTRTRTRTPGEFRRRSFLWASATFLDGLRPRRSRLDRRICAQGAVSFCSTGGDRPTPYRSLRLANPMQNYESREVPIAGRPLDNKHAKKDC